MPVFFHAIKVLPASIFSLVNFSFILFHSLILIFILSFSFSFFLRMDFIQLFQNNIIGDKICKKLSVYNNVHSKSIIKLYQFSCTNNSLKIKGVVRGLLRKIGPNAFRNLVVGIEKKGLLASFLNDYHNQLTQPKWKILYRQSNNGRWLLIDQDLNKYAKEIYWVYVSKNKKLSENFIRKHSEHVSWPFICKYQKLTTNFITKFSDKVVWRKISRYQNLSEEFITKFSDKVVWRKISRYQNLSEECIRKFSDKVVWKHITVYQKLSQDFIREFRDMVIWDKIAYFQILSEDFIREFKDKLNWNHVLEKQNITVGFAREFADYIFWQIIAKMSGSDQVKRIFKVIGVPIGRIGHNVSEYSPEVKFLDAIGSASLNEDHNDSDSDQSVDSIMSDDSDSD